MEMKDLTSQKLTTLSKYEGLGAAMTAKLVIGFWFGIGVILAVKMVNGLIIVLKRLSAENKLTEQVQQVTMKDPKKVEVGKRLAEHNLRKREECAQLVKAQSESKITYYGAGAVAAIEVLGVIDYYIYQSNTPVTQPKDTPVN